VSRSGVDDRRGRSSLDIPEGVIHHDRYGVRLRPHMQEGKALRERLHLGQGHLPQIARRLPTPFRHGAGGIPSALALAVTVSVWKIAGAYRGVLGYAPSVGAVSPKIVRLVWPELGLTRHRTWRRLIGRRLMVCLDAMHWLLTPTSFAGPVFLLRPLGRGPYLTLKLGQLARPLVRPIPTATASRSPTLQMPGREPIGVNQSKAQRPFGRIDLRRQVPQNRRSQPAAAARGRVFI
jgi:hypothetical protein